MAVAAYASLVSLTDVLDSVQLPGRRHRLHLDKEQIQSLHQKVLFLQHFLELHSQRISPEMEDLARQLAVVADEADDIIDFHVVNQLLERSQDKTHHVAALSSFCQDIDKIIKKIDSITEKLMMVKEERVDIQEQPPIVSVSMGSTAPSSRDKNTMVGFDERLLQVVDELTRDESDLRILPIVGMGGIGNFGLEDVGFPTSLKKLRLSDCEIPWKKMTIIGSSLPNLEVLKLYDAFVGPEWSPIEGEFLRLKVLVIMSSELSHWGAEEIHFPKLHGLYLEDMRRLKEIPLSIGDIYTLQSIHLRGRFSVSATNSAVEIFKDQKEKGNETLQVYVDGKQVDEEQVLLDSHDEQVSSDSDEERSKSFMRAFRNQI
ncbi:uncharacterized protein LOC105157229 isoform X1 [Sesamum indicum]|uniref:Uncharacterized protein LOC105157229 isoform X1 n=1 Tax=Sesamum indicum TaxID=4182 RepID=A0A6I9SP26_SESIN|nr:uncharacterized protein LOC105157229 isoform X1 [Sesamum indicum]